MATRYSRTWQQQTRDSSQSLPHVTVKNFHLSSAFTGLYDDPCPFPNLQRMPVDGRFSLFRFLKRWKEIIHHLRRFPIRFGYVRENPLFPTLVAYLPDKDPNTQIPCIAPLYCAYQGKKFNGMFLKAAEQLHFLESTIPKEAFKHVCEIGGGLGSMTEMIVKRHRPELYCIIDLPETLCVSQMYLETVFPGHVFLYAHGAVLPSVFGQTSIVLIPAEHAAELHSVSKDISLFINSNSFAEMDFKTVQEYFALIEQYPGTYLSNTNPPRWEGEHLYAGPETYPYCDRWEFFLKRRQTFSYWKKNYQMISHLRP